MTTDIHTIRQHAVRLLNPFRGVMNIIEYKGAEAVTIDGINWDIYVKDISLTRDMEQSPNMLITEIRFGHWSEISGLRRGPIYPSEDFNEMERQGLVVYEYLLQNAQNAPFALNDDFELWLLDQNEQPLALLGSSFAANRLFYDLALSWTAGMACKDFFTHKQNNKTAQQPFTRMLESTVRSMAGKSPQAQWFHRQHDISIGLSGINLTDSLEGREMDNSNFPEFFIPEVIQTDIDNFIFEDYLNFLAPYLLTLPTLTIEQRSRFEQEAARQALCVERLHHLYPDIQQQKYINSARIEARLRNAHAESAHNDDTLSPEYIELEIPRSN
jgi:hypothetical protein